jgi:hypothetical protein
MRNLAILSALAISAAMPAAAQAPAAPARQLQVDPGRIIFYSQTNYNGEDWEIDSATSRFRWDYNIRSFAMHPGDRWQICARPRFQECIVLDRSIPDASLVGITASIGSVRPAPEGAPRQDPR